MNLKSLFDMAVSGAVHGFGDNGEVPQVALAIAGDDRLIVIPCPWNGEDERAMILASLRRLFKIKRVRFYAFVSEAWFGAYDPDSGPLVMPSKSERRKEVIFIVATDGTERFAGFMEILRPFDGGPATLAEIELFPEGQSGGDLLTLLS